MGDLEALEQKAADIHARLKETADQGRMLKLTLSQVRREIAAMKKAEKKLAAPMNTIGVQLRSAQEKIRAVRVSAAKALRARGATIAEVEQVLGVSYTVIQSAEQKFRRMRIDS